MKFCKLPENATVGNMYSPIINQGLPYQLIVLLNKSKTKAIAVIMITVIIQLPRITPTVKPRYFNEDLVYPKTIFNQKL